DTPAGDRFSQTWKIQAANLRQNLQQGFRLGREPNALRVLVIVEATEPEAIVEQDRLLLPKIHQHSAEPAVELLQEADTSLFVERDEVPRVSRLQPMPPSAEALQVDHFRKLLSGQDGTNVFRLVPDRLAVDERILLTDPANGQTQPVIAIASGAVKALVHH